MERGASACFKSRFSAQFVSICAEEVKVKIERVDLWADRMDLVPEGDGFDGFAVPDLCTQNLCDRCRVMTL